MLVFEDDRDMMPKNVMSKRDRALEGCSFVDPYKTNICTKRC